MEGVQMSDTPRTDAAFRSSIREANDSAEPLNEMVGFSMKLERELTTAQERIKRLEEAGDELEADKQTLLGLMYQMGAKPERLGSVGVGSTNRWNKAKEAKL
jgi:hypothetical protein